MKLSRLRIPFTTLQERGAKAHAARCIHLQQMHRSAAGRCEADDLSTHGEEVLMPHLCARIEKAHKLSRFGVKRGEIRSLIKVATVASESQVQRIITAAMLLCNDVLDLQDEG